MGSYPAVRVLTDEDDASFEHESDESWLKLGQRPAHSSTKSTTRQALECIYPVGHPGVRLTLETIPSPTLTEAKPLLEREPRSETYNILQSQIPSNTHEVWTFGFKQVSRAKLARAKSQKKPSQRRPPGVLQLGRPRPGPPVEKLPPPPRNI